MKSGKFAQMPNCDETIVVAVPSALKAKIFAQATQRGLPASIVVREALVAFTSGKAA